MYEKVHFLLPDPTRFRVGEMQLVRWSEEDMVLNVVEHWETEDDDSSWLGADEYIPLKVKRAKRQRDYGSARRINWHNDIVVRGGDYKLLLLINDHFIVYFSKKNEDEPLSNQFGCMDMLDFVEPRTFQYRNANELDRPRKMVETLWAVINDTCEGRGRFFAVSNYIRWAFGELSPSGDAASITFSFESTLLKDDGTVSTPPDLGCNTLEMLVFFVDWALKRQLQAPAIIA
ncbi:hypothetical protein H0H93_008907 [Arthromyces matolae]|nr:hypothetical protein H0H93_008907 [Arthromyces matolae]